MFETGARVRKIIPEETMLSRLAQSEQMREFFIQMWMENPGLAKQGGIKVQDLMTRLGDDAPPVFSQQPSIVAKVKQRGISLIELIMFIVIVSVALAGILLVMNVTTRGSADPLVHKQALAIAESLLEEVELMPFTYCDPDDVNAASAVSSIGCAATVEGPGPETIGGVVEDRYGGASPSAVNAYFDNVSDYGGTAWGATGFTMNAGNGGIKDITNTAITLLNGYSASVVVSPQPITGIAALDVNGTPQVLLITVTVTGTDNVPVVVEGMRTRYSPRGVP